MAMALGFLLVLVASLAAAAAGARVPASEVSAFLKQHGLPGGLLPDAVDSYSLSDEGKFEVHLESECYHKFDNLVWYAKAISGKLSYGKIEDLSGIEAKELFVWIDVTGIRVDESNDSYIFFDVGLVSKRLKASSFAKPPNCGKGQAVSESVSVA